MAFEEAIIEALKSFPSWLTTFIIAMLPVIELRGSIPVAVTLFHMDPTDAFFISIIGNMIPVPFILKLLKPAEKLIRSTGLFENTFDKVSTTAKRRTKKSVERYKFLGLTLFVSIPLPITGAWTASLAAYLLRMDPKKAFLSIFIGVIIAGVIVTLASIGIISFWGI